MTEKQTSTTETFIDPVCGMEVAPAAATGSLNQNGETYYFCSAGCLQQFVNPTEKETASCCAGN
ncbi:MAG: YHS domain-containing protein [Acidobacteriota bacterium]|nr:MAG: YHS domain-containing protein [Acidobacteriota bacterium]